MTIAQYLRLLREQWLVVALITLLGLVGAGVYTLVATPSYEANTELFVSTTGGGSNTITDLTQGGTFTQQRVKSYVTLVATPKVLDPVIQRLGLATTSEDLAKRVKATSPLDTVLLDVTVTDPSPQRASDIANAIADTFPAVVESLETPKGTGTAAAPAGSSPVKVTPISRAIPDKHPVSPSLPLDLALGLLLGLGLGVGAAVLRESLDGTVGARTQASEAVGAPVLGMVADDPGVATSPLIIHDPFSPRAESFRQLRTNIRFLSVDHRIGSFVVTGSVPQEGKTTTAINIAISLAQGGEHVVLIDADLRRPTIGDVLGLPTGVGLTSVLLGDAPAEKALQRWRDDLPLSVLAAGPLPPNPSELISSVRMADLIRGLVQRGYTVVVDSPPLLPVTDATILARITDGAVVVSRAGSTKLDQLTAAADALKTAKAPILGVVLNRVPKRGKGASYYGGAYHHSYTSYAPHAPVQQPVLNPPTGLLPDRPADTPRVSQPAGRAAQRSGAAGLDAIFVGGSLLPMEQPSAAHAGQDAAHPGGYGANAVVHTNGYHNGAAALVNGHPNGVDRQAANGHDPDGYPPGYANGVADPGVAAGRDNWPAGDQVGWQGSVPTGETETGGARRAAARHGRADTPSKQR